MCFYIIPELLKFLFRRVNSLHLRGVCVWVCVCAYVHVHVCMCVVCV